uniref:Uncharacterized protein n=1 Tax=Mycena chlorophos TaxID=658473 RepID=A0ABQ0KVG9_MYCCL|nr:predicted protein [Mycena chlorophos]
MFTYLDLQPTRNGLDSAPTRANDDTTRLVELVEPSTPGIRCSQHRLSPLTSRIHSVYNGEYPIHETCMIVHDVPRIAFCSRSSRLSALTPTTAVPRLEAVNPCPFQPHDQPLQVISGRIRRKTAVYPAHGLGCLPRQLLAA